MADSFEMEGEMRYIPVRIYFPVREYIVGDKQRQTIWLVEPEGIGLIGFAWHLLKVAFFFLTVLLAIPLDDLGRLLGRWRVHFVPPGA